MAGFVGVALTSAFWEEPGFHPVLILKQDLFLESCTEALVSNILSMTV